MIMPTFPVDRKAGKAAVPNRWKLGVMAMGLDVIRFIFSPSITQKKSRGLLSAHGFKIVKKRHQSTGTGIRQLLK
jgi:hypothetical protein